MRPSEIYTKASRETYIARVAEEGYKIIAFRVPQHGEWYLLLQGDVVQASLLHYDKLRLILEKL